MRTFTIQVEWPERDYPPQRREIPWDLIAPHEAQALKNHCGQSLARLDQRGGCSAKEVVAILEDKEFCDRWPWSDGKRESIRTTTIEAITRLREYCEAWEHNNTPAA